MSKVCNVFQATSPYLSGVPGVGSTYAQYYGPQLVPAVLGHDPAAAAAAAAGSPLGVVQQPMLQQKLPRSDRLEVSAATPTRARLPLYGSFARSPAQRPGRLSRPLLACIPGEGGHSTLLALNSRTAIDAFSKLLSYTMLYS